MDISVHIIFEGFPDEDPFTFKKMHEYSTADGFVEVGECLADMIKYVANEPSLGFFYIQQHIQNSAPNLINLKNNVVEKSREMTLHTEDSEDSISMIRSMRECGYVIADDMIKDITSSLAIMATKQPKKGLIRRSSSSSFKMGRTTSSWGRSMSSSKHDDVGTSSYLSSVMRSTKLGSFRWPQVESKESSQDKGAADGNTSSYTQDAEPDVGSSSYLTNVMRSTKLGNFRWPQVESRESGQDKSDTDGNTSSDTPDELPISSQVSDEIKALLTDQSMSRNELLTLTEDYVEFKADKEAKLLEWLGEAGFQDYDKRQEIAKDLGRYGYS